MSFEIGSSWLFGAVGFLFISICTWVISNIINYRVNNGVRKKMCDVEHQLKLVNKNLCELKEALK